MECASPVFSLQLMCVMCDHLIYGFNSDITFHRETFSLFNLLYISCKIFITCELLSIPLYCCYCCVWNMGPNRTVIVSHQYNPTLDTFQIYWIIKLILQSSLNRLINNSLPVLFHFLVRFNFTSSSSESINHVHHD